MSFGGAVMRVRMEGEEMREEEGRSRIEERRERNITYEEHRIGNLVLADSSTENDHTCLFALDGQVVEAPNIANDVD